jgi:2-polyprenyl-3-methyl-5-hydroxy-6-metoxy-1,4-benzoquinol methylase
MAKESFELFRDMFFERAKLFKKTFLNVQSEFGEEWENEFDLHLEKLFSGDEEAYGNAISGYTNFSIDAMRLQKIFNKKLAYEDVSYEDALEKVYLNEDYMMKLYLPGIFVSHFLWRHHYRQFLFYKEKFLPLLDKIEDKRFYDVGTGTGFYTTQILRHDDSFIGHGIDISPHSRQFTLNNINGWGFQDSFKSMNLNIIGADLEPLPVIQSVEVLEHLTDPQLFLDNLRKLLKPGGYGFITAALTAPNADHIYLYWTPEEVIKQLETAGFSVKEYIEEKGYEGKPGEHVPIVAAFIVS